MSANDSSKKFLNVSEVAQLLGCSPRTIYAWVSMKLIPFRKAQRRLIFDEAEVREWTKPNAKKGQPRY